jgi:uncharacterized protein YjiS (DUF1127 family)
MSMQSVLYREKAPARAESRPPLWDSLFEIILEWKRRARSRRELARLSYLDIKDIGYPATVEAEKTKPFWRK